MYKEVVFEWLNQNCPVNDKVKKFIYEMAKKADAYDESIKKTDLAKYKKYLLDRIEELQEEELFGVVSNQTILDIVIDIICGEEDED